MSNVFFTSDLHLDHNSLVQFRNKVHGTNFTDAEDVNIHIVKMWNSKVKSKRDIVWVLGDVSWSKEGLKWLEYMNGDKRLILGNHDTEKLHIADFLPYFTQIHGIVKKYDIVMSHVPIHPESLEFRWKYNMHGHIHLKERDIDDKRYLNVNMDIRGFQPMSLDEVRKELEISI